VNKEFHDTKLQLVENGILQLPYQISIQRELNTESSINDV